MFFACSDMYPTVPSKFTPWSPQNLPHRLAWMYPTVPSKFSPPSSRNLPHGPLWIGPTVPSRITPPSFWNLCCADLGKTFHFSEITTRLTATGTCARTAPLTIAQPMRYRRTAWRCTRSITAGFYHAAPRASGEAPVRARTAARPHRRRAAPCHCRS